MSGSHRPDSAQPLRIHTPQAVRPPSRILFEASEQQQQQQYGSVPVAPSIASASSRPLPSDVFSDTESVYSTNSTRSTRRKRRKARGVAASSRDGSPAASVLRFLSEHHPSLLVPVIVLTAILLKSVVSLGSYSGQGKPPLYGDLEAQRNWLSVTLHRPVSEWYFYNLEYWGLDYPPLTAYHSLGIAKVFELLGANQVVALRDPSQTPTITNELDIKTWMRFSVLWSDALLWVPAVLFWSRTLNPRYKYGAALTLLLQPALLLIDSGHFQFNSIMLGLSLLACTFFQQDADLLGAVCFVFSLCYKQMALYYAPAVFAYLLGKCINKRDANLFFSIAFVTLTSLALCFAPFLTSFEQLSQVIHRLFPFARGLFEDKVANVWCALNVVVKLRQLFPIETLTRVSLAWTLVALLPGGVLLARSPRKELLPFAMANSSLAFFLFSFQVHEKTMLLPLLPLTMIMGHSRRESEDFALTSFLNNVAMFSMWPLLQRDGLQLQYLVVPFMWNYLFGISPFHYKGALKYFSLAAYSCAALLHVAEALFSPPTRLPDLYPVLNVGLCAPIFGLAYLWTLKRLLQESWAASGLSPSSGSPPSFSKGRTSREQGLRPAVGPHAESKSIHTRRSNTDLRKRI